MSQDEQQTQQSDSEPQFHTEVIRGSSEIGPVNTDVLYHPYRCICHLFPRRGGKAENPATGWIVAPGVIITAAHVLYRPLDGMVDEVEVFPANSGFNAYFGSAVARKFKVAPRYHDPEFREPKWISYDIGAIFLPSNALNWNDIGFLPFAEHPSQEMVGRKVLVSGYPNESPRKSDIIPKNLQYRSTGKVLSVYDQPPTDLNSANEYFRFRHTADTVGGHSGSPVMFETLHPEDPRLRYHVVGVHTRGQGVNYSEGSVNFAIRLRSGYGEFEGPLDLVNTWRGTGPAAGPFVRGFSQSSGEESNMSQDKTPRGTGATSIEQAPLLARGQTVEGKLALKETHFYRFPPGDVDYADFLIYTRKAASGTKDGMVTVATVDPEGGILESVDVYADTTEDWNREKWSFLNTDSDEEYYVRIRNVETEEGDEPDIEYKIKLTK